MVPIEIERSQPVTQADASRVDAVLRADRFHLMLEAARLAYAVRDERFELGGTTVPGSGDSESRTLGCRSALVTSPRTRPVTVAAGARSRTTPLMSRSTKSSSAPASEDDPDVVSM